MIKSGKYLLSIIFLFLFIYNADCQINNDSSNIEYKIFYFPNTKIISSEGYLRDGNPDGYWKNYYSTGILKSEGNRKNFNLDGLWKFYNDSAQLTVSIEYFDGKKNGAKTTFLPDETIKENFVNDVKQGATVYFYKNGKERLAINFENGLEEGVTVEYDTVGKVIAFYEYKKGFLINRERINRTDDKGQKQGRWKYFYDDMKVSLEGTFRDDKKHGYFKEYDKEGNLTSIKKYINDTEQIEAPEITNLKIKTDYYPDGKIKTIGSYKGETPEGIRREYNEEGEISKAYIFKSGIITAEGIVDEEGDKQGDWKTFYEDGTLKSVGKYKNDKPVGRWKYFYQNSTIESEGIYTQKGTPDGEWKWFYEDGSLHRVENYINGLEDGEYIEYDETGKLIVKGNYEMGLEEGKWLVDFGYYKEEGEYKGGSKFGNWKSFYDNGKLRFDLNYIDNNLNGTNKWYWYSGTLKEQTSYRNGKKEGDQIFFNEDGTVFLTITYKNDVEKRYDGTKIKPPFEDFQE